jgi:hypothetical protein
LQSFYYRESSADDETACTHVAGIIGETTSLRIVIGSVTGFTKGIDQDGGFLSNIVKALVMQ